MRIEGKRLPKYIYRVWASGTLTIFTLRHEAENFARDHAPSLVTRCEVGHERDIRRFKVVGDARRN